MERLLVGLASALLVATMIGAFAAYNRFGVIADNVASVKEDLSLRDYRERMNRDSLIRVEEQLKCESARRAEKP